MSTVSASLRRGIAASAWNLLHVAAEWNFFSSRPSQRARAALRGASYCSLLLLRYRRERHVYLQRRHCRFFGQQRAEWRSQTDGRRNRGQRRHCYSWCEYADDHGGAGNILPTPAASRSAAGRRRCVAPSAATPGRADISGQGAFYRVEIGPLSPGQADQLCGSLKAAGGQCIGQYE